MSFSAGTTNTKQNNYNVFLKCTEGGITSWTKIGACLAEPTISEEKGEDIKVNDGSSLVVSKNANVAFTLVNVDKQNRDALNGIINKNASIMLSVNPSVTDTLATGEWLISNVMVFPALSVKGNAVNQIEVTGQKEIPADDFTTISTL